MGPLVALVGTSLTLLAAIGVVRFPDVLARMHALTKASTVGVVLVLVGGSIAMDHPNDVTTLLLAAVLQLLTVPVAANLMSRSTYLAGDVASHVDGIDELAESGVLVPDGTDAVGTDADGTDPDGIAADPHGDD